MLNTFGDQYAHNYAGKLDGWVPVTGFTRKKRFIGRFD